MNNSSLKLSLTIWEWVNYVATACVLIGVVGEYLADLTQIPKSERDKKTLGRPSTLVLMAGLAVERGGLVRTTQLSGRLIGSLEQQTNAAIAEAESARKDA